MPAVAGVHSTSILIGLSTSARVRCFERLAERPSDWLTVDDDVVVTHWRRLILSAGGHGPLIALLANTLERQRQSPNKPPRATSETICLAGAYARIMERNRIEAAMSAVKRAHGSQERNQLLMQFSLE